MIRILLGACFVVSFLAPAGVYAQERVLAVKAHVNLTAAADGFTGRLELLEDARITPALDKTMWQSGGPELALDPNDPLLKQLAAVPLHSAVLRLSDAKEGVIAEKILEREQARLEVQQLHPGHRSILVTTDLTAEFGSYSGPSTQILDVSQGNLGWAQAVEFVGGAPKLISLASTGKAAWRLVAAPRSTGRSIDILEVGSRPKDMASASPRFITIYTRYHWNGKEWRTAHSDLGGIWESDRPFPSFARFPSIPMDSY